MKQSCKFHELVTSNVNFDVATVHFIIVEGNPEAWICMIKKQTDNTHSYTTEESRNGTTPKRSIHGCLKVTNQDEAQTLIVQGVANQPHCLKDTRSIRTKRHNSWLK